MITSKLVGVLAVPLALAAPVAAPASAAVDPSLNSKNYSVTWSVENNSQSTFTVESVSVDNGATIQDHDTSVAPGGVLTITATNHGNGVQMWVTLVDPAGEPISLDADVPKVNMNWISAQIGDTSHPQDQATYGFTEGGIAGGNNPTAWAKVISSSPGECATNKRNLKCTDNLPIRSGGGPSVVL